MVDDNPLDDDLLRELGLEPRIADPKPEPKEEAPVPPKPAPSPKPKAKPTHSEESRPPPIEKSREGMNQALKNSVQDMPVQLVAVLGKKSMSLKELVSLQVGEMIDLKKLPEETIDLVANGKLIARGMLVLIDGKIGLQIKQLV